MLSELDTLLSRIDEKIIANLKFSNESNFTLFNGSLGKLLYLNERIKYIKTPLILNAYKDLMIDKFSQIITGSDFLYYKSSLMYGAGGVLYTYNQFVASELIETNKEIEQSFGSYILSNLNIHEIDIFHGFTGGFISLNSCSKKSVIDNVEFTKSFIHYINNNLSQDLNNINSWKHVKNGIQNIGVAHGLPNLIYLSKLLHSGTGIDDCITLYEKIKTSLINLSGKNTNGVYRYNFSYSALGNVDIKHRLSWCYCDLGIALVSMLVAKYFRDDIFFEFSKQNLLSITNLFSVTETGVDNIGVCHGSFGVFYLYHKAYELTQLNDFKVVSEYWLNKSIEMLNLEEINDYGLLDGLAGVGLVLNSYLNPEIESTWDRCLLLS